MKKKQFQRLALLFLAVNEKYSSLSDYTLIKTLEEKVNTLTTLANKLCLLDDKPDKPP